MVMRHWCGSGIMVGLSLALGCAHSQPPGVSTLADVGPKAKPTTGFAADRLAPKTTTTPAPATALLARGESSLAAPLIPYRSTESFVGREAAPPAFRVTPGAVTPPPTIITLPERKPAPQIVLLGVNDS